MYGVYYRIVFKAYVSTHSQRSLNCHRCSLLVYADKGITPENLPHFVPGQHDRAGSLAFLGSNNSILICLFYLLLSFVFFGYLWLKKYLDFWLYFGLSIKWQECYFSVSIFV